MMKFADIVPDDIKKDSEKQFLFDMLVQMMKLAQSCGETELAEQLRLIVAGRAPLASLATDEPTVSRPKH